MSLDDPGGDFIKLTGDITDKNIACPHILLSEGHPTEKVWNLPRQQKGHSAPHQPTTPTASLPRPCLMFPTLPRTSAPVVPMGQPSRGTTPAASIPIRTRRTPRRLFFKNGAGSRAQTANSIARTAARLRGDREARRRIRSWDWGGRTTVHEPRSPRPSVYGGQSPPHAGSAMRT